MVFFVQSDWLLYLGISCTIYLASYGFLLLSYGRRTFLINKVTVSHNTKNKIKFDNKVFKYMYFLYFLAINALRMCSKCFVYKWWVGDKPMLRKSVCENNYARYMLRQLFTSVVEVDPSLQPSTTVNNCFIYKYGNTRENHNRVVSLYAKRKLIFRLRKQISKLSSRISILSGSLY